MLVVILSGRYRAYDNLKTDIKDSLVRRLVFPRAISAALHQKVTWTDDNGHGKTVGIFQMRGARINSTGDTECQSDIKGRWQKNMVYLFAFSLVAVGAPFISINPVFSQSQPTDNLTPQQRREAFERQRTLDLLKNQTDDAGQRLLAPSDPQLINDRINGALEQMQGKHAQTLNDMRNARYLVPDDDTGIMKTVSRYSPMDISSKEQDYKREEDEYRTTLQRQEGNNLRYAQSRAADLQADADNLASQLKETKANQSFRLSPVGTNMYVRNFETVGTEPREEKAPALSTTQSQSARSPVGRSDKAIIPPGWNPLEEPGRKLAPQASKVGRSLPSKSQTLHQNNVKGKALN